MKMLSIAFKEIKMGFRHKFTFLFMLGFPIVLMLILGTALSNAFSDKVEVGEMKVLYRDASSSEALHAYWKGFTENAGKSGVTFTPAAAGLDGQEQVREAAYTAFAEMDDSGIKLYGNSKATIESNIIQGMLATFADRYNTAAAAMKSDPSAVADILGSAGRSADFIKESSLQADRKPGSLDYYAIAMTTMIALYAAMSASSLIEGERTRHTSVRLSAAPIGKLEIFAGKVLGSTFLNLIFVIAVVLFSKYVFKANWGNDYGYIFLVLLTEVLLAVSMGLGLSFLFNGEKSRSFIMIFVQIVSFTGGAYFPLGDGTGIMDWVSEISPLRWANRAMNGIIYSGDTTAAIQTMGLNILFAAAFLAIGILMMRKREAL